MIKRDYIKIKLSDLKSYEKNNKKHWENVDEIVKSIQANTYIAPIIIDENNVILAGHGRKFALDKLQVSEAEVLQVSGLSEEQKRDFRIRDNKLTELSEWDFENIKFELDDLDIPDLSDLFKDEEELQEEEVEAKEDDYEIPETITTDIVLWDLFEIGEHRLLCGDSTDSDQVAKLMNGEKADMVFTDPPYNVNAQSRSKKRGLSTIKNDNMFEDDFIGFMYLIFKNLFDYSKENSATYVWHNHKCQSVFEEQLIENNYEIKSQIIWVKDIPSYSNNLFRQQHEIAFYCSKKGNDILLEDGKDSTIWNIPSVQSAKSFDEFGQSWFKGGSENLNLHVTQKPIQLPLKALQFNSKQSDLVLDLFLGSGSTMVASHQLKRKCYGMELDPKYCQVIIDRMKKLDPELTIKKNWAERDHTTGDYTLLNK